MARRTFTCCSSPAPTGRQPPEAAPVHPSLDRNWRRLGRPVSHISGMMQLRGSCLVSWDDLLPPMAQEAWQANVQAIARTMEE